MGLGPAAWLVAIGRRGLSGKRRTIITALPKLSAFHTNFVGSKGTFVEKATNTRRTPRRRASPPRLHLQRLRIAMRELLPSLAHVPQISTEVYVWGN